jgi:hypothetical protein
MPHAWIALLALIITTRPEPVQIQGTICRLNRHADRMIVLTDEGTRTPVVMGDLTTVTFEKTSHRADDLRLGDRIHVSGLQGEDRIEADTVDVHLKVAETIVDALLGIKPPLVGRFGSREARTEYFSFELPDGRYIRVDARSAYGAKGRVWVSTLRSNDLLELSGEWKGDNLYRASTIRVLTDEESSRCRPIAGETKEAKAKRLETEQRFLDGIDQQQP